MKAILEFNLDDPEDRDSHQEYLQAPAMRRALWDFSQEVLRKNRKYGISQELLSEMLSEGLDTRISREDADLLLSRLVAKLEAEFYSTLQENGVDVLD